MKSCVNFEACAQPHVHVFFERRAGDRTQARILKWAVFKNRGFCPQALPSSLLPSPLLLLLVVVFFFFGACPISRAARNRKKAFRSLKTLATQANGQRIIPTGQGPSRPARVGNHSTRFGSS